MGLELGGNYVWCLVIVAMFVGFGGEERRFKVIIWGGKVSHKVWCDQFLWGRGF